ncbi:FAM135B [Bugula neritina]|uniref:FAM135B n=1 Tax=Bugula neritina TaxID=10212 RepID=A0A7J7KF46_BUGNE|nr:FAM135B [Bugula neritina]
MAKKTLHTKRPIAEPEYRDCHTLLDTMCKEAESVKLEDDFLLNATSKIAHLCAYNVVLWQDFTETVTHNNRVKMVLAKEYHQSRVKRFSEAFFTQEWSKSSCLSVMSRASMDTMT